MQNEHIDHLIIGFLNNELTPSQHEELKLWTAASAENQKHFDDWQELWFSSATNEVLSKYNHEQAFEDFQARVATLSRRRFYFRWLRYAAVFLLLVGIGYGSYWYGMDGVKSQFADITMESPHGSRSKLILPDGTIVWLNAGSKLTYSQAFGVDNRNVSLEGEGYFEVHKNTELPFLVNSRELTVQVHGTKFNVTNYPETGRAVVSLSEGKVSMYDSNNKDNAYFLSPGQRAVYDKHNGDVHIEQFDTSETKQWTTGKLKFEGQSLLEIAKTIERVYNVNIHVSGANSNSYHFYGDFDSSKQSALDVLNALCKTGKLKYRVTDNEITIY